MDLPDGGLSTMEGRAKFGMLSVLAELQRELIVVNTNDGLVSAQARGRVGGRQPKLTEDQAALAQRLYGVRPLRTPAAAGTSAALAEPRPLLPWSPTTTHRLGCQ
ncbi:hypothetical protein ACIQXA_32910 [Streptomyces massasporeus]|uniref:hypothetical protein n=1 Tax=Streptomyces massasporeus TaxID=67324 RepID=UPI00381F9082